jgi:hypothetical protein
MTRVLALSTLAALLAAPHALAEEPAAAAEPAAPAPAEPAEAEPDAGAISGDVTVTFTSGYLFRGYRLSKDSLVVQPAANLTYRGFTLGFWSNVDTDQHETDAFTPTSPGKRELNEADLNLSYERELGIVTLGGGWLYYGTKYAPETEELFVTAAVDVPGQPTLTVFRDLRALEGWYVNLCVSHELALPMDLALELSAAAGFYSLDDDAYTALHDGALEAALTIPLPDGFTARPRVTLSIPLSDEAKDEAGLETAFAASLDLAHEF